MLRTKDVKTVGFALACAAATATAGWSPPETISPPGGGWTTCYNFANAVVADGAGNLHAVFFEATGAAAYYRRYDRAAGRWDPLQRLDETGGRDAAIIVGADGELHAFFKSGAGALGHRVGDAGGNWGPYEYLTVPDYRLAFPSPLLLPSGDVALAMVGERYPAGPAYIWFTTWRRATKTFDPPARLSDTSGALGSWMPTLASFRGELRLAWRDDSTGEFEIYERVRNGSRWSPVRRLTFNPAPTYHPRYALDGGGPLRLVFMDRRRGRPAIWEMDDDGGGWGREYVLFDGGGESYHPNVAPIPGGGLLLFWEDARGAAHKEIYFATLRGGAWSAAARVTSSPATDSGGPSAAVTAGGEIAVVYAEAGKGIRVQRLPLGEAPVGGVTFRAAPARLGVALSWAGRNLALFSSFNLYRKSAAEPAWRRLNATPIAGRAPFSYYDEPPAPGDYVYKLEGEASPGEGVTLGSAAATVGRTRPRVEEPRVRPNPCRDVCYVSWSQAQPAAAAVAVYDIIGRRVLALTANGVAGRNELSLAVGSLAPGSYVVVVTAAGTRAQTMFVVTR